MKEIKVTIGKGGRVRIDAKGSKGGGTAKTTKELADKLGDIEERHKGIEVVPEQERNQEKLNNG